MELVRSGGRLVRDNTLRQAILGGEGGCQDVEFRYLFERRVPNSLKTLRLGLGHRDAVKNHLALEIDTAVNSFAECAARHARGQEHKRVDLAAAAAGELDR